MSSTPSDKTKARLLALAMHVVFIVLIVFGVSWQHKAQSPVQADLWSNLPPLPQPKEPPPAPEPPPKPVPVPKAAPLPPPPKVESKPQPKPDIALKQKAEKEKKVEPKPEAKPKPEPKKRDEEKEKAARLQKEAEARQQREAQERELKKLLAEKEASAKAAAQAAEQSAAVDRLVNEYKERIAAKVRHNLVEPPGAQGVSAEFAVVLIPGGDVLSARLTKSSGNPAYDQAAERAIMKSAPMPLPPNPELFSRFRDLHLIVRPQ